MEFVVGDKAVKNFKMIERHYFRNKLLKDFEFDFPFCMPNTTNTCEHIYDLPVLSAEESKLFINPVTSCYSLFIILEVELVSHPYETKSDSFYFVEGTLVMHNKADYAYTTELF